METIRNLTVNDKKVLTLLLDNGRVTDSEIAGKIRLTPQGVRKIRKKLEKDHIKEYRTIVDYDKIGISVFVIAQIKVLNRQVLDNKSIIGAFEINESDISHIIILGFSTLEELDGYKKRISKDAEIRKINVLSKNGLLKNSPVMLMKERLRN